MTSSPPTNTELFSEDLALHLVPRSGHTHEPPTPVLVNFRVVQAKSSRVRAAFPPFAFLSLSPPLLTLPPKFLLPQHLLGIQILISGGFDPQLLWKCEITQQVWDWILFLTGETHSPFVRRTIPLTGRS